MNKVATSSFGKNCSGGMGVGVTGVGVTGAGVMGVGVTGIDVAGAPPRLPRTTGR